MSTEPYRRPAIAGTGAIACGLAAASTAAGRRVWLLGRSRESCDRALRKVAGMCEKLDGADAGLVEATTEAAELAGCDLVMEAIVEEAGAKAELLGSVAEAAPAADLATTTSSLSVTGIADACGQQRRLYGLHVFNPVTRMELVELCLPEGLDAGVADRARTWCEALDKTAVEVPDRAGFVVNRLLFPYLFDAVRLKESTGMSAEAIDSCMSLGVAHPMGPLGLLDLVGLDVAVAIGEALNAETGDPAHLAPGSVRRMREAGDLGRKSGRGFYDYSDRR